MFRIDSNKTAVVKLAQKVWCVKARFDSRPFKIVLARRQQLIALQFEREGLGCNLNYTWVKIEHKTDVSLQSAFKAQITSDIKGFKPEPPAAPEGEVVRKPFKSSK